jgi:hypothetical protein
MRTIRIDNPLLNTYITDLAANYSSGTTATVRSNNSFAADDLAVFGNPSEELTEIKKISSISGTTTFNLASALNFAHNKGTPIYKSLWDYVSIEGRSSSAGVFAELTQSGIQWDSKTNQTIYNHASGTDTWQYRFRFYNSVTASYSEYSPTLIGSGFTKRQMGYIIREARREAGDKEGRIMSIEELLRCATRAKNSIRGHNGKYWFWKVDGYNSGITITATAGTSIYSLANISEFGTIDYIEYKYTNGSTNQKYALRRKGDIEFQEYTRDLNRPNNDFPHFYRLLPPDANSANGYFEIENKILTDGVGTFYTNYYREEPDYNSIDDETDIVIPEILQDYLISNIYATKGNEPMAEKYMKRFTGPEGREKTLSVGDLEGIALLDELDKQYKKAQGQPQSLWRFRGQKAISRLFGNRQVISPDYVRENYFDGVE